MINSIKTVLLIAIILSLLIPRFADVYASDPAFTPDNLVILHRQNN